MKVKKLNLFVFDLGAFLNSRIFIQRPQSLIYRDVFQNLDIAE
jgi:hypothetical protein